MALQLMKLFVTGTATTIIDPQHLKYFYVTTVDTAPGDTLTIAAEDFFDDSGVTPTALPALIAENSLYNVYVNGVLQMEGITTYTPGGTGVGSLAIEVPSSGVDSILASSPIILEIINYDPSSTVTIST